LNKLACYIIAAEQVLDGKLIEGKVNQYLQKAKNLNLKQTHFYIDALRVDWNSPLAKNHFRSGNGPLEAVEVACQLLKTKQTDYVLISGEDFLRSGYERSERRHLMEIYQNTTLPEAYTKLAQIWGQLHHISDQDFILLAEELFKNYCETFTENKNVNMPEKKWFDFITPLFRGVDCANPIMDYSGKILLMTGEVAEKLNVPLHECIEIKGIATTKTKESGLQGVNEIVHYTHLQKAFLNACQQAQIDFLDVFKNNKAYFEIYTCFPIVPLAFLFASGLAQDKQSALNIIQNYPLTISGGMNLAKGPWNNPVLRAVILLYYKLQQQNALPLGAVHGNGGLGEKQGFVILGAN